MYNKAAYNPLNTTLKLAGSHPVTPIGVQAYTDWEQGLLATVKTLAQSNMGAITSSLARSASADETLRAVGGSPWGCTICGKTPAASLWYYANKTYPGAAGLMGSGIRGALSPPSVHAATLAAVAVGVLALLALASYEVVRKENEQV